MNLDRLVRTVIARCPHIHIPDLLDIIKAMDEAGVMLIDKDRLVTYEVQDFLRKEWPVPADAFVAKLVHGSAEYVGRFAIDNGCAQVVEDPHVNGKRFRVSFQMLKAEADQMTIDGTATDATLDLIASEIPAHPIDPQ
jgi:hypothetical protein